MTIPAGNLLDLEPLQRLDGLGREHVAGVAMPQPPEVSPAPAVDLQVVLGVGGGVVGAADDRRDPGRVEAAEHCGHEAVLRVAVPELAVLAPAPRAQRIAREERDGVASAGGDEHDGLRRRVGGGHDRVHLFHRASRGVQLATTANTNRRRGKREWRPDARSRGGELGLGAGRCATGTRDLSVGREGKGAEGEMRARAGLARRPRCDGMGDLPY